MWSGVPFHANKRRYDDANSNDDSVNEVCISELPGIPLVCGVRRPLYLLTFGAAQKTG